MGTCTRPENQYYGFYIPKEVKIKYFPNIVTKYSYDVLPLFELDCYKKRLMKEVSVLENAEYAKKWQEFREGLPQSAKKLKPAHLKSNKIQVFANYKKQQVAPEYSHAYIGPPNPEAIYHKTV